MDKTKEATVAITAALDLIESIEPPKKKTCREINIKKLNWGPGHIVNASIYIFSVSASAFFSVRHLP